MSSPFCQNPSLILGNCEKFAESWKKLANGIPEGVYGNGVPKLGCPYAETRLATPSIPYEPKTASMSRSTWEGWRYGSNYVNTDDVQRPYGFPDYQYYRGNYCGPCCSCVSGTSAPPLVGDPNGKNPNIRYIQLDYKNLLGSGFASQGPPTSQTSPFIMSNPGAATGCGRNHCPECAGVYKKTPQPVKFQVCIGNPTQPETVQPCPPQPMKIYVPLSVLPKGGPDGDQPDAVVGDNEPCAEDECKDESTCVEQVPDNNAKVGKQEYEVLVPGQELAYNQQGQVTCGPQPLSVKARVASKKKTIDPCGSCNACKNTLRTRNTKCRQ